MALSERGVCVDGLFFPVGRTDPSVGQECQFALDSNEARVAMKHRIALVRQYTHTPESKQGVSDEW